MLKLIQTRMPVCSLALLMALASCGGAGKQQQSQNDAGAVSPNNVKVPVVKVATRLGDLYLYLYEDTPKHRQNFLKLARNGFYDGTTFHRIIDGFMIQGGDPNTKPGQSGTPGQGGPGYTLAAEIKSEHKHSMGALAAARKGDAVNPERRSSGSQFYIVENEQGAPFLNGKYTVFGETISGMDVVHKIAAQPKNRRDQPKERIEMTMEVLPMSAEELQEKFNFALPQ